MSGNPSYLTMTIFSFSLASLLASASALSLSSIATDLLRSIAELRIKKKLFLFSGSVTKLGEIFLTLGAFFLKNIAQLMSALFFHKNRPKFT
jgi:hypothetical protein